MDDAFTQPAGGLQARMARTRTRTLCGRARETAVFQSALGPAPAAWSVLHLQGPGGIGKSTLLDHFAHLASAVGRRVVRFDGHALDPVPEEFEERAGAALHDAGAVLLVDTFERCQGLEGWLRRSFLPRTADGALLVLAGRTPLSLSWRTDPGWREALRVLPLRNLGPQGSDELLAALGVAPQRRPPLREFAGGHPLALTLAGQTTTASDSSASESAGPGWRPPHEVVAELLPALVDEAPSDIHRRALEACAHARCTTQELLRAALPGEDSHALFEWLRLQPYIEAGPYGLVPHDAVRACLDADLRWRDPEGYEALHHRLRAHLLERARTARGRAVLPAMDAVKYLHRGGAVTPRYFVLDGNGSVYEDLCRPSDHEAVLEMAEQAEGPHSAKAAAFWLARCPQAFRVHRDSETGRPVGFIAWLRLPRPDAEETAADPVVAAAWRHSERHGPVREGEHIALARFMVYPACHQRPSASMDLMMHRVLAGFIDDGGQAWTFVVWSDPQFWEPLMSYSAHHEVAAPVRADDRSWTLFAHDWRVMPMAEWLAFTGEEELFGPAALSLPAEAETAVLSGEEFDKAVREALKRWHRSAALVGSPLVHSRLVRDRGGTDPVPALRDALAEAVDSLRVDPREVKYHRALTATFFDDTSSQEAAAQRLELPFSTYRRHLSRGLQRVVTYLWRLELGDPYSVGVRES
ncbi:ATP-binding protein [Streptomyces sp. NPDC088747]|uniref:ATP-binding protein n=1 Tax=Streptomyces sp. NPDC088747 TaxID=3365886 RepID=UPI003813E84F